MAKPRVAYIILGGETIGGADKRFVNLFNHLSLNNTEFDFFLLISQAKYNSLEKSGVINPQMALNTIVIPEMNSSNDAVHRLYRKHKKVLPLFIRQFRAYLKSWSEFFENMKLLKQFYKQYNVDIVHMIYNPALFVGGLLRKRLPKPKLVYTMSDSLMLNLNSSIFKFQTTIVHSLKNADYIDFAHIIPYQQIVISKKITKKLRVHYFPYSFVFYDKLSCDYDKKHNAVSFVARLVPSKNPMLFIEIAYQVLKTYKYSVHFYICGNGPLNDIVEAKINEYQLQQNVTLKYCTNINEILGKSKILISLTQTEDYNNQANLEAMACENVVISTNSEISKDICPGIIVLEPDAQTIALKIIELLENPEKTKQMGQAARQFAMQNHNVEKFAHYITGIYRKVLTTKTQ